MKRFVALLVFALGSVGRRPGRALATGAALAVVTAALASTLFLTDALRAEALRELAAAPDLTVSRLHGGRPVDFPSTVPTLTAITAITAIPGVSAVRARVWGYIYLQGAAANLTVVGVDGATDPADLRGIVHSHAPIPGTRGWAVPGVGVATLLGLTPGDGIELGAPGGATVSLRVNAVMRGVTAVRTADVVLCDIHDARTALGMSDGEATDLAVTLATTEESAVVARRVTEALPGAVVTSRAALARAYALTYDRRGGLLVASLLPALLALLLLAWNRATDAGADARQEIAALRCAGWSTRDVVTARVLESAVTAAVATLTGSLGAYGYVFTLGAPGLRDALLGFSSLYPRLELTPVVTVGQLVTLAALTAGPYVAAAVVPAWHAATLDPAEALQG